MRLNQAFRLGLHSQLLGSASWLPTVLFAASEQGAWYDPSDLTSMRQLSTGATGAAVASPVGFIADKRLMGGKTFDAFVAGQPELVTNGGFADSGAGWTAGVAGLTYVDGVARYSSVSNSFNNRQSGVIATSKNYVITYTISNYASGTIRIKLNGSTSIEGVSRNANGTYTEIITSTSTADGILCFSTSSSFTGDIDNVSVKEIPGNHATQATAAARPILGREPVGGRRNLLTFTEQFDNAAWVLGNGGVGLVPTRTLSAGTSPAGVTACRLQLSLNGGTTATDISSFRQSATLAAGAHTFSVWLRSFDGSSSYVLQLTDAAGTATNITVTGTWQRFPVTGTAGGGAINLFVRLRGGQSPANSNTADILFSEPQLETGSTATDYQKVVSQYDVTEAGVSDVYYLAFDGVDDSLATASIDFSATDEMSVIAGVRKLSDAAAGTVAELSASSAANNGTFGLFGPGSISPTYGFHSRGTVRVISEPTGFSAPITNILTGLSDISADSCILRENGAEVASTTANQGTGNFLTYPLYIGRRGGATLPFNGRIYSLIVRGLLTSGDDLTNAETYVAGETGFTAPSITGVPTIGVSL